jgi:hypothetical protein
MLAFFLLMACNSEESAVQSAGAPASARTVAASPFYTGDGGKGMSVAILPLKETGLTADQGYLPALVQSSFVSSFKDYSAIDVLDRAQLQKQYDELLGSGYYDENAEAGLDLGKLPPTTYIMDGNITRRATGYALQIQITNNADKMTAASYTGTCTFAELDNLLAVRRASLELLEKIGVQPTERTRTELVEAARAQTVDAQTADAKGYTADKGGRTAEAAIYYTQAAAIDPSMLQTASRASTLTASIASGSIGAGTRDLLRQHDDWRALLAETEETIYKLISSASEKPPYALYYSYDIKWGDINYQTRSRDARFEVNLRGHGYWFDSVRVAAQSVYGAVYDGLTRTGHKDEWGLGNWPGSGVTRQNPFATAWRHDINVVFELVNDQGKAIGRQTYSKRAEYAPRRDGNKISISYNADDYTTLTFNTVKAEDISDQGMSIRVASVNGKPPEQTPFRITAISGNELAGSGPLVSRYSKGVIGKSSEKLSGSLIIPAAIWGEPVTSIADEAFLDNHLTSVVILNGITSIGNEAFASTVTSQWSEGQLTSITIPDSVTSIGRSAFDLCKLTSVVIPDGITTIKAGLFRGNHELTSVTIPDSVTSIEQMAFAYTRQLTSVTIGANVNISSRYLDSASTPYKSFITFYNRNGKKAGTYTRNGNAYKWSFTPR